MVSEINIETERLVLRTVTLEDVEDVAASWKLDDGLISLQEAKEVISRMQANHANLAPGYVVHLCLAIIEKETRTFIGWCGLDHTDLSWEHPVLFYLLKESWWGKGLATEAASALLQYAFDKLGLKRIDSSAAAENIASKRVMEKIGMRSLGVSKDGGYSFTISKEDC